MLGKYFMSSHQTKNAWLGCFLKKINQLVKSTNLHMLRYTIASGSHRKKADADPLSNSKLRVIETYK